MEKGIMIGDIVGIKKAGDVIPEVIGVLTERRTGNEKPFVMTKTCPICGSVLVKKEDESAYYCVNDNCNRRIIEGLIHYASRDAMNITGFGERIIEDFYNFGYLKSVLDFYHLDKIADELKELEGFGEKSIENLLTEIENSKKNSLEKLLFGLGIRYVGKKTAKILARTYKTMDNLSLATYDELKDISDIGDVIALSVSSYFKNSDNIALIQKLKELNLNMNYLQEEEDKEGIAGKTFVITGTLSRGRDEIREEIEHFGGKVSDSVSSKTDYVIVGDKPGSKSDKAQKLGVTILQEDELNDLLH